VRGSSLVIPTAIPFDRLRSRELEECVYWLLDSMGAKELEWRLGSEDSPTADQGRDIEARFSMSSPDADVVLQRWWVECKGRKGTVEAGAVQRSLNNVTASSDIDVFVIVTNSRFSNPTRNWVKQWAKSHRLPTVKLWDKTDLERLLCRHPAAVLRVFSEALTPQGRLVVLRERFWQHTTYATEDHLKQLWQRIEELEWGTESVLAVVASEFANGSISRRPWLVRLECGDLLMFLRFGLANVLSFCLRAQQAGVDQDPYLDAMGYLLLRTLARYSNEQVLSVLGDFMDAPKKAKRVMQGVVLAPLLHRLLMGVTDACTRDCVRVSTDLRLLAEDEAEYYWGRLRESATAGREQTDKLIVTFEDHRKPCKVGFAVDKTHRCPLLTLDSGDFKDGKHPDLKVFTSTLMKILRERIGPPG
jgi:hypothetical protein